MYSSISHILVSLLKLSHYCCYGDKIFVSIIFSAGIWDFFLYIYSIYSHLNELIVLLPVDTLVDSFKFSRMVKTSASSNYSLFQYLLFAM